MFPPEETVTCLLIGSLIFGTRFLITLLHPLLLPVLNANSVSFTLMSSHCFYICFRFCFWAPASAALWCLCVLLTHYVFTFFRWYLYFRVPNKFDWLISAVLWRCYAGVLRARRTASVTSVDFVATLTRSCVTRVPGGPAERHRSAGSARRRGKEAEKDVETPTARWWCFRWTVRPISNYHLAAFGCQSRYRPAE